VKRSPMPARVVPLRRTPLATVTPLRGRPLAQVIPLQRRTPLKPRSTKTAKLYREQRVPLVAGLLHTYPWCQIRWDEHCHGRATAVHEPGKRSHGADICDPAQCVTTCGHCHDQVHGHPAEAEQRGWLIRSSTIQDGGDAA
jgi:hypothetical protein